MEITLDNVEVFISIVATIVSLATVLFKYFPTDEQDFAYLTKDKQMASFVSKSLVIFLCWCIGLFCIGFSVIQSTSSLCMMNRSWASIGCIWCLLSIIFIATGDAICTLLPKVLKWLQTPQKIGVIKKICFICYCISIIVFVLLEQFFLTVSMTDLKSMRDKYFSLFLISLTMSAVLTIEFCLIFDWIKILQARRRYIKDSEYGKLYLLYSIDDDRIMCELIDQTNRRQYVPLARDYINGKIIYTESNDQLMSDDEKTEAKSQTRTSDKAKEEEQTS